jgi:hypothetical protein
MRFIGHPSPTCWTKKDSEDVKIFPKVEPYLTFLNIPQLERQGADIQSKVDEIEEINQSLSIVHCKTCRKVAPPMMKNLYYEMLKRN